MDGGSGIVGTIATQEYSAAGRCNNCAINDTSIKLAGMSKKFIGSFRYRDIFDLPIEYIAAVILTCNTNEQLI